MSELTERWRLAAAEWLDAQDAADLLSDSKADVFAEMSSKASGATNAEKERNARTSPEWRDYRTRMTEANSHARRLKMRLTFAKMQREDWLNGEANKRAEMKL